MPVFHSAISPDFGRAPLRKGKGGGGGGHRPQGGGGGSPSNRGRGHVGQSGNALD